MKGTTFKKLEYWLVFLFFLFGLTIRLLFAQKNIILLDRQFIPDDTYYILSLARSFADTHQFLIGSQQTNGFQPLIVFILAILANWFHQLSLLHADLIFLAVTDSLNILLIAMLAHQLFKKYASCIAALFWAISPLAISNCLSGMESSLSIFFTLLTLNIWLVTQHTKPNAKLYFLLGISIGLTLLSRIDTAFLIVIIGLYILYSRKYFLLVTTILGSLLILLPWWGYEIIHFHSILPESGMAVKFIVRLHQAQELTQTQAVGFGAAFIFFAPFFQSHILQEVALQYPNIMLIIASFFIVYLFLCFYIQFQHNNILKEKKVFLISILLYGACIFIFYIFYLPALWFFSRYLEPVVLVITILLSGTITAILSWDKGKHIKSLCLTPFSLFTAISLAAIYHDFKMQPTQATGKGFFGAKGYAEVAMDVLAHIPQDSTLGALQSGALSYFANNGIKVINLDGVVNRAAAIALRKHRLADYAKTKKINYLADWHYNIDVFIKQSSLSQPYTLNFITRSKKPQCDNVFEIYKIKYFDAPLIRSPKNHGV